MKQTFHVGILNILLSNSKYHQVLKGNIPQSKSAWLFCFCSLSRELADCRHLVPSQIIFKMVSPFLLSLSSKNHFIFEIDFGLAGQD